MATLYGVTVASTRRDVIRIRARLGSGEVEVLVETSPASSGKGSQDHRDSLGVVNRLHGIISH